MKPDLIVIHPDCIVYPLWMRFIKRNRDRFNKVIVVFTDTNWGIRIRKEYIQQALKHQDITWLDNGTATEGDWRDVATNKALKEVVSEWVWFMEQDFEPKEGFWEAIDRGMKASDLVYMKQGERMHPACFLIKKTVLDRTHKDFAAYPELGLDHFGRIQQELENWVQWEKPLTATVVNSSFYYHMNGLTHNLHLLLTGKEPNYNTDEFRLYLQKCKEYDL